MLLRGLGRSQGHWGDFPERMRAAFPSTTVLTPDLPGAGERRAQVAPASIAGTLAVLRAELPAGEPVSVLGLSMGGMVAYEWRRRHPDELAEVVLVSSSLGGLVPPWRRLRLSAAWRLLRIMSSGDALERERLVFAMNSNRGELADTIVPRWAALARAQPLPSMNGLRQLVAAATYRAAPVRAPSPVPLLLLASRSDHMVDPACSHAMAAAIPGSSLEEHPTAGHDLPLDDPEWVIARILAWRRQREAPMS